MIKDGLFDVSVDEAGNMLEDYQSVSHFKYNGE